MKKRFFGILLMGAMVIASMSTFTSCKDYDDDINALKERIDANSKAIGEIQKLISNGGVVTSVSPIENGVRITMSGNLGFFDITNGVDGKDGKDGQDGAPGAQGEQGPAGQNGLNGKDGKDGTAWTIGEDGFWYENGVKTEYYALSTSAGSTTTTIIEASPKYYIPNAVTGCFDIYQDGVLVENTNISFLGTGSITATMDRDVLTLYGIEGALGPNNSVNISLTGVLKSMVFIPYLYLDGIESIEYPWIGDTTLAYVHRTYNVDRPQKGQDKNGINLSHHGTYPGYNLQDIKGDLDDYLPNTLGRYLEWDGTWNAGNTSADVDGATGRWVIKKYDFTKPIPDNRPLTLLTGNEEWIYGPVWPVQYELNPANAAVDYKNNAPNFKVLQPEVIYYNTRAAASALKITSPEEYEYYDTEVANLINGAKFKDGKAVAKTVFGADKGDLTVGLKIAHPNLLAPWPTDETINPNGNTDSDVSYPANQNPNDKPFNGAKDDESYGSAPNKVTYGSWYGYASYKYNKDNKDNTVALQMENTDGEASTVTSDYALIVPSRVTLEGMIWYQKPMYAEPTMPGYDGKDPQGLGVPAYGPKNRIGDEEGWAWFETGYVDGNPDTNGDCTKNRVHVWDSPQEALADPDGAALELNAVGDGLDLKPYLGVHVLKENIKHKETAPGVYNPRAYDLVVWDYNEVQKWGLHWEYELVEYISSTNVTSDSRYATFSDWVETEQHTYKGTAYPIVKQSIWNKKTSRTGVIIARNVTPDGLTTEEQSTSSVDREPLVRVLLKNAEGKVLLDGYILLHINNTPGNLEIRYPEADREFDLCEPLSYETTWSQFSRYILTDNLKGVIVSQETGAQRYQFDDWYWADCMTGTGVTVKDTKFVSGDQNVDDRNYITDGEDGALTGNPYWTYPYRPYDGDARLAYHDFGTLEPVDGHNRGYQLKIYNFGDDIYGNGDLDAIKAKIQAPGNHNDCLETSNEFENKALGDMIYFPNGEGTTNHTFDWHLSEEEIEYLTHHKKAEEFPVKVSRWFRFIAKDYDRERLVNNYSAPYPYIWVKMTMSITRKQVARHFAEKIANYWYQWNPEGKNDVAEYGDNAGTGNTSSEVEKGWSAMVIDIEAPRDDHSVADSHKWPTPTAQTLVGNIINSLPTKEECKYYFAPKGEFVVEAIPTYEPDAREIQKIREGKNRKYVITTRNKNYGEPFIVDKWGYVKATKYVNSLTAKDAAPARPNYNWDAKKSNPGYDPQKTYYNLNAAPGDYLDYRNAPGAKTYYNVDDPNWTYNKIYCRYVWPHQYVNFERNKYTADNWVDGKIGTHYWANYKNGKDDVLFPFINNTTTINTVPAYNDNKSKKWYATSDTYTQAQQYYKADFDYWDGTFQKLTGTWDSSTDAHKWDEKTLKGTLDYCTMLYEDEPYTDAKGNEVYRSAGAFNNDILYAVSQDSIYTPIARIVQQAYPGASTVDAGKFELIHYLPVGATYDDFIAGNAVENYALYDVLNGLGYPLDKDKICEFDFAYRFLMHELNGWVGTVAVNECNVARYMDMVKTDDPNVATYVASWQRPINLDKDPIDVALDANTNENIIYLIDYLKLYDWRGYKPGTINGHDNVHQGYMWDNHLWFWAYYNIRKIEVDLNPLHVKTTLHAEERPANQKWAWLADVSRLVRFYNIYVENYKTAREVVKAANQDWVTYPEHATGGAMQEFDLVNISNRSFTFANNNDALKAYMGYPGVKTKDGGIPTRKALFGGFYYENNGDNVTEFDVRIPITIWYEWGKLETVVEWHINTVHRY